MKTIALEQTLQHFSGLPAVVHALFRLETELPASLTYHSVSHTRDVLKEALTFGLTDSLSYHQLYLLALAAVFHDIGFIVEQQQNEQICARLAREALSTQRDLTESDLAQIESMILDTTLRSTPEGFRQLPTSPLSGYLLDADLGNFGRMDFLAMSELVRLENGIEDRGLFYRNTLSLFDAHRWNTDAAQTLRGEQKTRNRIDLLRLVESMC